MDIRITTRRTLAGATLVTVRCITADDVLWYRQTLPLSAPLAVIQQEIIRMTLAHLARHGGPAARLVTFQLALPMGG